MEWTDSNDQTHILLIGNRYKQVMCHVGYRVSGYLLLSVVLCAFWFTSCGTDHLCVDNGNMSGEYKTWELNLSWLRLLLCVCLLAVIKSVCVGRKEGRSDGMYQMLLWLKSYCISKCCWNTYCHLWRVRRDTALRFVRDLFHRHGCSY